MLLLRACTWRAVWCTESIRRGRGKLCLWSGLCVSIDTARVLAPFVEVNARCIRRSNAADLFPSIFEEGAQPEASGSRRNHLCGTSQSIAPAIVRCHVQAIPLTAIALTHCSIFLGWRNISSRSTSFEFSQSGRKPLHTKCDTAAIRMPCVLCEDCPSRTSHKTTKTALAGNSAVRGELRPCIMKTRQQ